MGWLLSPPPSGFTNPFNQPAVQQKEACGELAMSPRVNYAPTAPLPTAASFLTSAQMNNDCFATSTPVSHTQANFPPQTMSLFTPCMPQHVTPSHAVQALSCDCIPPRAGPLPHRPSPFSARHKSPIVVMMNIMDKERESPRCGQVSLMGPVRGKISLRAVPGPTTGQKRL